MWRERCTFPAGAVPFVRKFHLVACIVQLITGSVLWFLADSDTVAFSIPLYTLYTNTTSAAMRLTDAWVPSPVFIGHFHAGYSSAAFLFLSALNHFICATNFVGCCKYIEWVEERRASPVRWGEYAFSASLMHVQIAILCGILDVHLLAAIGALTATTMVFGLAQELQYDRSFKLYILGFIPWVAQWALIISYFNHGVRDSSAPDWVYAIIVIECVLDFTFAVVLVRQEGEFENVKGDYRSKGDNRMLKFDTAFIVLSLTAKQSLAWVNYGGARH